MTHLRIFGGMAVLVAGCTAGLAGAVCIRHDDLALGLPLLATGLVAGGFGAGLIRQAARWTP